MNRLPTRTPRPLGLRKRILTPASPEFSINVQVAAVGSSASGAWFSANDPIALAFRLSEVAIAVELGWLNGSAAGGGVDVGIYDASWVRLVSTGAQTGSGNNAWQFVNVTDTTLLPGKRYYLAMARDNITANRVRILGCGQNANSVALGGGFDSATDAYPLPNPLTNMAAAATTTTVPVMALALRAPF